jgi:septum formation protein
MVPPDVSEVLSVGRVPKQEVIYQARRKAAALVSRFPEAIVLGSDTLISLEGEKIGKPTDDADATAILQKLRGRTHEVLTGVSFLKYGCSLPPEGESGGEGGSESALRFDWVETARVTMHHFSDAELEAYVATGDPLDKAGGYSVQGAGQGLVATVEGDFLAVVGLPLRAVAEGLRKMGVTVPVDMDTLYRERNFLNWRTFK